MSTKTSIYEIYQNSTWRWYYKGRFSKFPDYYLISNLNLENILESDLIWIRDAESRRHLKKIATKNKIEVNCDKKAAQIFRYQNNVLNCIKYDVEHFDNKSLLFQIKKIVYKSKILTETFKMLRKGLAQLRSTKEVIS